MSEHWHRFMVLDAAPLAAAVLAAFTCALLGSFLLLRRLSLMGDAISHAVLPGLVIAFLLTGTRAPWAMLVGAAVAGLFTVALIELLQRAGRLESSAAMGVVFSVMFALGVLLLRRAAADQVDLDADCVLYGNLENIAWWAAPDRWDAYLSPDAYLGPDAPPRQVPTLAAAALASTAFVLLFFKELRITSFDPLLATSLGFPASAMHLALMAMVAVTTVASFEAVGSILVIAMLICPAATARLLTDRLERQVALSALIGAATGAGGYIAGSFLPQALGFSHAVNAAGAMTILAGLLFAAAVIAAPRHGVIARHLRRRRLALRVAREDLLAALYRSDEQGRPALSHAQALAGADHPHHFRRALRHALRAGLVRRTDAGLSLTDSGKASARPLVRTHRLWETYLVSRANLRPDHVHHTAEHLEHLRDPRTRRPLAPESSARRDPHDRPIPPDDQPT